MFPWNTQVHLSLYGSPAKGAGNYCETIYKEWFGFRGPIMIRNGRRKVSPQKVTYVSLCT